MVQSNTAYQDDRRDQGADMASSVPIPPALHDHGACIDRALARADALCAERGARLTALRRRVLELVWQDHAAVKAYDLLRELDSEAAPAKPPTVYRALDFLMEQGLVHRLESLNAYVGCPRPEVAHEGCFMICEACGRVREFEAEAATEAIAEAAREQGFEVLIRTVEVRGRCRHCPRDAHA
jgi:Fur family zinc uptake transcriptional regulator